MDLVLERDRRGALDTTGQLYEMPARTWLCYVLEDRVRAGSKVYGETAIPAGRYQVKLTRSPRFGRDLPLLLGVPGFDGIRIHTGNDASDTEGCLLPGLTRELAGGVQRVGRSRDAFAKLMLRIQHAVSFGEQIWIEIKDQ